MVAKLFFIEARGNEMNILYLVIPLVIALMSIVAYALWWSSKKGYSTICKVRGTGASKKTSGSTRACESAGEMPERTGGPFHGAVEITAPFVSPRPTKKSPQEAGLAKGR